MRTKLKVGALLLFLCVSELGFSPSSAGQQMPDAGKGRVKVETRFYSANRVFPASSFDSKTLPSTSRVTGRLTKIVGDYGLGGKWALLYDLRFASIEKSKKKETFSAFGLQDQTIGIEHGLRQRQGFSDAVDLKFVLPTGSTTSVPQLGTGHFAIQPDYEFDSIWHLGERFIYGDFSVGPRVFTNSGVTQLRLTGEAGGRLISKFNVFGTFFLSKNLEGRPAAGTTVTPNASEFYDLLRVGGGVEFAGWKFLRPMIAYQRNVAGRDIHAGSQIVVGFTLVF